MSARIPSRGSQGRGASARFAESWIVGYRDRSDPIHLIAPRPIPHEGERGAGTNMRECSMLCDHPERRCLGIPWLALAVTVLWPLSECRADRVIMKNGLVYISQGNPDRDNSLVYIWDGLKR